MAKKTSETKKPELDAADQAALQAAVDNGGACPRYADDERVYEALQARGLVTRTVAYGGQSLFEVPPDVRKEYGLVATSEPT